MRYIIVIALAYLIGCSNMAKYIAYFKKVDLSAGGSGNPGASNAVILMGWSAGVLTALHDIGKSALAVVLARLVFPDVPHIGAVAGVASVLGHIYPFWMKFKGGKASYASYFFGKDSFGIIDPEGGGLEMIIHDKGTIGGPLNQFSTIGYKFETNGATILYPERLLRVMSASSFSGVDEIN